MGNRFVDKANNVLLGFLVAPGLRWVRHLILFLVTATMVSSSVVHEPSTKTFASFNFYVAAHFGPIYLNLFYFTPRFLFRNKISIYVFSQLLAIVLTMSFFLLANVFSTGFSPSEEFEYFGLYLLTNISSNVVSLVLLIAGTSCAMLLQQQIRDIRRIGELEETTTRSELEQLKNQINPHFLFNMLNNANVLVKENPPEAEKILRKLREMLAYQLEEGSEETVLLSDEMEFLSGFLGLEDIRRDRFRYVVLDMDCPPGTRVPPLMFIPFVENAVKHGADSREESYVLLLFRVEGNRLEFMCTNSKPGTEAAKNDRPGGLGLANIKRRLQLLYGPNHWLNIHETEKVFTVNLHIEL